MDAKQKVRCPWPNDDKLYQEYHDKEWGVPVHNDRKLFEFLLLEGGVGRRSGINNPGWAVQFFTIFIFSIQSNLSAAFRFSKLIVTGIRRDS